MQFLPPKNSLKVVLFISSITLAVSSCPSCYFCAFHPFSSVVCTPSTQVNFISFSSFLYASSFFKLLSFCSVVQNNQTSKLCPFWSRGVWTFENPQKKGRSVVLPFFKIALSFERNREALGGQTESCGVCLMRLWGEAGDVLVMIRCGECRWVHLKAKHVLEV